MTTQQVREPEGNELDDFDEDPLWDVLGIEGCLHMMLVQFGTEEKIESARHLHSHCVFCRRGIPDHALRAFLVDGDNSLLKEFMARGAQ